MQNRLYIKVTLRHKENKADEFNLFILVMLRKRIANFISSNKSI